LISVFKAVDVNDECLRKEVKGTDHKDMNFPKEIIDEGSFNLIEVRFNILVELLQIEQCVSDIMNHLIMRFGVIDLMLEFPE
jgi:hypothetical protein